ncbi:hypothetical protein EC912_11076 [Luteibacter rhizovicinus]|uniref:Uncharacterized protein n=1 Tax=Luteibacter rhizovicinus TaxID=242606 RepID=A0A4R3YHG0_9GAMM|nr:hypothetical protein [Luteibacter rhizovicinus]TCV91646.1 hypothetical protein EC912_11076 [Luteibacter rhizovicinus]
MNDKNPNADVAPIIRTLAREITIDEAAQVAGGLRMQTIARTKHGETGSQYETAMD